MNRLTKAVVVASTLAAALVEVYLATTPLFPFIFWFSIALAAAWFVAGDRVRALGLPIAMGAMYLMPGVYWGLGIRELYGLEMIWILPLIGLIVSGRGAWEWSLPRRWHWPLVAWALVVAVSWPIVFLRELDFYPPILFLDHVANTSIGIFPWDAGGNIAYFALGHMVGLLWIDALYRWCSQANPAVFRNQVLFPLAVAAAVASAVAIYQGFVDLRFLNSGFWAYMLRASGTLGDPNKLGMIAAFWAIGSIALGRALPSPWSLVVSIGGLFLAIAGIWVSGTRTGLAALLVGLVVLAIEGVRYWRAHRALSSSSTRVLPWAVALVVLAIVTGFALQQSRTHTVFGRGVMGYVPFFGDMGIAKSVNDLLWERFGYGPAAIQMLREYPAAGVGVGAYHTLVHDYGKLLSYDLPADNAQNWYRHLIAELGVLGSVPWIWWCVVLVALLFSRVRQGDAFAAGVLRGALIGFAIASLFGMAGQSMAVILTFWTFVYWFAATTGVPPAATTWSNRTVALTAALLLGHTIMTVSAANGGLLPRHRAARFDWPYSYGLSGLDRDPNGGPGRRWTLERAVAVIPVQGRVLKFVGWIDHPDADDNPVDVEVRADSKVVYSGALKRSAAITLDIPAAAGASHMEIETRISRLWRPSDYGREDRRQLGLSIRDWQWE